jgi:hypothetical protein
VGINWSKYRSDYVSFSDVGTSVEGTIVSLTEGSDYNGQACPQLVIDTADGVRTVTAGQTMLKAALAEHEPDEGDWIRITYTGDGERKPGRAPTKLFAVEVRRASGVSAEDLV